MFMDRCGNGNVANPVAERSVGGTGGSSCLHLLELAEPEQRSGTSSLKKADGLFVDFGQV
jgi:hypothetical protein